MIRFKKPTIKRKDMDNVLQTMVNEQIGSGDQEKEFMTCFSQYVGLNKAVGFRTYFDCIRTALRFAGAKQDTVVAISALAPSVYQTVLNELGCVVKIVDVEKETGLSGESTVSSCGADLFVLYENCGSLPVKYDNTENCVVPCDFGDIPVLEDISESIGSSCGSIKPGYWGNVVVCSFEQNDVVSAGGGAAFAIKDDSADSFKDFIPNDYLRMTDMGSALGIVQLDNLEENCAKMREIWELYENGLKTTQHKVFGLNMLDFKSNANTFSVFLNCKPDDIIKFAEKHDVPVEKTFSNSIAGACEGDLFEICPVSASYYHRTISFPIYPFLKATEIDIISKIIAHLP